MGRCLLWMKTNDSNDLKNMNIEGSHEYIKEIIFCSGHIRFLEEETCP